MSRLETTNSRYPFALMIPQSETERLLERASRTLRRAGRAAGRAGEPSPERRQGHGHAAARRRPRGDVRADWLIGCDGAHSAVRHGWACNSRATRCRATGYSPTSIWRGPDSPDEIGMFWHATASLAFFPIIAGPLPRDRRRGRRRDGPHRPTRRWPRCRRWSTSAGPAALRLPPPIWLPAFRINERKVTDYRARPRVPGRRCGAHPQPGRRPGHEHRHAGRLQPGLEAGAGIRGVAAPEPLLDSYPVERSAVGDRC